MNIKKVWVWLMLLSGRALAYQENFTVVDALDFSVDVGGTWVLDGISNFLGFLPVFIVFLLFALIIVLIIKVFKGIRGQT